MADCVNQSRLRTFRQAREEETMLGVVAAMPPGYSILKDHLRPVQWLRLNASLLLARAGKAYETHQISLPQQGPRHQAPRNSTLAESTLIG